MSEQPLAEFLEHATRFLETTAGLAHAATSRPWGEGPDGTGLLAGLARWSGQPGDPAVRDLVSDTAMHILAARAGSQRAHESTAAGQPGPEHPSASCCGRRTCSASAGGQ